MKKSESIPVCEFCFKNNGIFKSLTNDEINMLNYVKTCNSYKRGDTIYHESNRTGGVYCISDGIIKHYKTGIDGKEQIVKFSKQGGIFGFRSILSEEAACTTTKAIKKTSLCFIPAENFLKFIKQNSKFSMTIMKMICKELGDANQYILNIAQKNVRERLAEILLLLNENFGVDKNGILNISLTRKELAGIIGTADESVIRLLSEFKKDRIIQLNRRKIKLLNLKKLKKITDVY